MESTRTASLSDAATRPEPGWTWARIVRRRAATLPPSVLALASVAVALLTQLGLSQYTDVVPHVWVGFVLAIGLLGVATISAAERERVAADDATSAAPPPSLGSAPLPWRWELAAVAAVLLMAAFFRFWRLLSFPPGLWYDEGVNAADAVSLIDHDHVRLWFNTVFGRSTLYLYMLAASFKVFGYTLFAIRVVPATAGLAALVLFYFLARRLMGQVPALVATALFGVSRWAVVFSRISWEASIQPVIEVATVYFLIRGIDTKSKLSFALAGIAMAAGLYTYIAFRMVPIFVALLLIYIAVSQWRTLWRNVPGLVLFAAAFLLAVMPLALFALEHTDKFTERTREVSVFKEIDKEGSYEPLWSNIKKSVRMLNVEGDGNGRHNLPFRPMLDEVTAALVVLGLGVSVWSFRNWRRGAIAPWLVLSLVPGALTLQLENPSAIRGIGALPPIFLLVGLAASAVYRTVERSHRGRIAFAVAAISLIGWSAIINYHDVFQEMAQDPGVYADYTPEFTQVARAVADHADSDDVYATRIYGGHNAVAVLAHGKTYKPYDAATDIVFPPTGRDVYVVADTNQLAALPSLRKLYPNLTTDDYIDQFGESYFTRITIPSTDVAAAHELSMTVAGSAAGQMPARARIDREWTADDLAGGPIDVTWDGYLWGTTQATSLVLQASAPGSRLSVEFDGRPASLNSTDLTASLPFAVGEHHLRVSARIERPGHLDVRQLLPETAPRNAADWVYPASLGDHGFRVLFHQGRDMTGKVVLQAQVPFSTPLLPAGDAFAIEMEGNLDIPQAGAYAFALDGSTSAQLLIDDALVVDNGGVHNRRRVEGDATLTQGQHHLTVQYIFSAIPDMAISVKAPGADSFALLDGQKVTAPTEAYTPPAIVTVAPDDAAWPGVSYPGFDEPRAVALLPDGSVVAANTTKLLFMDATGHAQRLVDVNAQEISDIAATSDGRIVAMDAAARTLLILDRDGKVTDSISGFASASGIGITNDFVYVASPSGGIVYKVTLANHKVETLGISAGDAPVRAAQPSDVAVSAKGDIYVSDFEKRTIVKTSDGSTATASAGLGGTGTQTPRLTTFGPLIIATDPTQSRIAVYDSAGKQRGVYNFPGGAGGAVRPIGVQASADGYLYVADQSGFIRRVRLVIPPDTAAQLLALP
jgi:4-amino-4-deoxy-L-arabinose transferase-like glycosyltransferase